MSKQCAVCRDEHPWGTVCTRDPREVKAEKLQEARAGYDRVLAELEATRAAMWQAVCLFDDGFTEEALRILTDHIPVDNQSA